MDDARAMYEGQMAEDARFIRRMVAEGACGNTVGDVMVHVREARDATRSLYDRARDERERRETWATCETYFRLCRLSPRKIERILVDSS